jgi:hypothetical protein
MSVKTKKTYKMERIQYQVKGRTLPPNGVTESDFYGYSVFIDNDTKVVTAPRVNSNVGAAYVYTRMGQVWSEQQVVPAPSTSFASFGKSVPLSRDTFVVGDYSSTITAIHIYVRTAGTWTLQQTIGEAQSFFRRSVSIDGDTILVSADVGENASAGRVYVYVRSSATGVWTQEAILTPDVVGETNVGFGWSVSLSGDTAAIGTAKRMEMVNTPMHQGAVYVFAWASMTDECLNV